MTIISVSSARLAARIGSYINARRIAGFLDTTARICWPPSDMEVNNADEIFSSDFIYRTFIPPHDMPPVAAYEDLSTHSMPEDDLRTYLKSFPHIAIATTRPLTIPGETTQAAMSAATTAFSPHDFSDKVQEMLEEVETAMRAANYIGIHIRRGDILEDHAQAHLQTRYQPLPLVARAMEKYVERDADVRFIVASDDDGVRHQLLTRFPQATEAQSLVTTQCTELQGALRDMIILSRCKEVVAPSFSGFSTIAAMMGGHERIDGLSLLTNDEKRDAMLRHFGERGMYSTSHLDAIDYAVFSKLLLKMGDRNLAKKSIEKALSISPHYLLFHLIRFEISAKLKDPRSVLESATALAKGINVAPSSMKRLVIRTIFRTAPQFVVWLKSRGLYEAARVTLPLWEIHDVVPHKIVDAIDPQLRNAFYEALYLRPT